MLIVAALLFLFAASQVEGPPPPVPDELVPSQGLKTQSGDFLGLLREVIGKTDAAHERVDRVGEIVNQIQELVASGHASVEDSLDATVQLTGLLKANLDGLHSDAVAVRDRLANEIIPEYRAIRANIKARLEVTPENSTDYREMRDIYAKSAENVEALEVNLSRLERNVQRIARASLQLCDRLDVLALWKLVELSTSELIDRLDEFNHKVEAIATELSLDRVEP